MTVPESAVRRFVGLVVGAAVLLWATTLIAGWSGIAASPAALLRGALLVGAVVGAARFPLRLTPKTKVHVDTTLLFVAALTFDPWGAMIVVGIGTAIHQLLRRAPVDQAVFNTAQTVLHVGIGSVVFQALASTSIPPRLPGIGNLAAVAGCALAMHLLNTWTVSTVGALQVGARPRSVWLRGLWLDLPEHLAQVGAGALAVAVAGREPWLVAVLVVPVGLIYVSMRRGLQVQAATKAAVEALAGVVDQRDPATAGHSARVAVRARQLGEHLGLPPAEVESVATAARVHDIGKVGLDPALVRKRAPLTAAEWEQVRRHPVVGADLAAQFPAYAFAARDIRHHHERWDGSGFPDGLAGEEIPVGARIIGVAEAFDSMIHPTTYRPALPARMALRELERGAGMRWDPAIVAAMVAVAREEAASRAAFRAEARGRPGSVRNAVAQVDGAPVS